MLIAMTTWDTPENKRAPMTWKSLESLFSTVDWNHHRFVFVDNGSDDPASSYVSKFWVGKINDKRPGAAEWIGSPHNLGTAGGINLGWTRRLPGEGCCKVDSDIVWEEAGWADRMEEAVNRHRRFHEGQKALHEQNPGHYLPPLPLIGMLGLKRNDCGESTYRTDWGQGRLVEIHHLPGERWINIEVVNHVVGSCVYHSPEAMDQIGYLYQGEGRKYGYDDTLYCERCHAVGMWTAFLHGFMIHHIDPGDTQYQKNKEQEAGVAQSWRMEMGQKYKKGEISVYYGPNGENGKK